MEHTYDPGLRLGDDVPREPAEGVAPRAARIHHGRYARVNAREVGIDGGLVDAVIDVRMQVYEARDDQLAIQVDYPGLRSGSDVGRDLGYDAVLDRHVHLGVDALRWVDYPAASKQKTGHVDAPPIRRQDSLLSWRDGTSACRRAAT